LVGCGGFEEDWWGELGGEGRGRRVRIGVGNWGVEMEVGGVGIGKGELKRTRQDGSQGGDRDRKGVNWWVSGW
jgi:hypothetical protein